MSKIPHIKTRKEIEAEFNALENRLMVAWTELKYSCEDLRYAKNRGYPPEQVDKFRVLYERAREAHNKATGLYLAHSWAIQTKFIYHP